MSMHRSPTSKKTRLFLLRHGTTEWNRLGRYNSFTDIPIENAARSALERTGSELRGVHIERILVSPLLRARQSADIAVAAGKFAQIPCEIHPHLTEMNFGAFEGLSATDIIACDLADAYYSWLKPTVHAVDTPGGETWEAAFQRSRELLDAILADGRRTLVVGHGYTLRLMIVAAIGTLPPQAMRQFPLTNAAIAELEHGHGHWHVLRHNYAPH